MEKSTSRTCTKGIHSMYGILTSDKHACFDYSHTFSDSQSQRPQFNRPFIFFINCCLVKCENNE